LQSLSEPQFGESCFALAIARMDDWPRKGSQLMAEPRRAGVPRCLMIFILRLGMSSLIEAVSKAETGKLDSLE
jgi:hypothetical protein